MSSYFLCDTCANNRLQVSPVECICIERRAGVLPVEKRMMVDYGSAGDNPFGIYGYLDTDEVCEFFEEDGAR